MMNLKGAYTWIDPKSNDWQDKNFSLMLGQSFRHVSSIREAEEIVKRSTNQKFVFILSSACLDDLSRSRLLDQPNVYQKVLVYTASGSILHSKHDAIIYGRYTDDYQLCKSAKDLQETTGFFNEQAPPGDGYGSDQQQDQQDHSLDEQECDFARSQLSPTAQTQPAQSINMSVSKKINELKAQQKQYMKKTELRTTFIQKLHSCSLTKMHQTINSSLRRMHYGYQRYSPYSIVANSEIRNRYPRSESLAGQYDEMKAIWFDAGIERQMNNVNSLISQCPGLTIQMHEKFDNSIAEQIINQPRTMFILLYSNSTSQEFYTNSFYPFGNVGLYVIFCLNVELAHQITRKWSAEEDKIFVTNLPSKLLERVPKMVRELQEAIRGARAQERAEM